MALVLKNRVQETTTTTGTGTVTLGGTAPTGFQTFANALSDGDTTYYQITDGTDWEIGLGTFISATNDLARTSVFESSNSNSAVDWGAGDKDVFIVFPASKFFDDSSLATVATTGSYNDLSNTPELATVATSGSYNDLSDTPSAGVTTGKAIAMAIVFGG